MAKRKEFKIEFVIDGKKGVATVNGLDAAVRKLSRNTKSAAEGLSNIGNVVTGFRSAISIIGQMQSAVQGAISAYQKQEQAEKALNVALGKNADGLIQYAAALQSVTTHGDEDIIRAESMLAAYTKDENQIKKLTSVTLDFADAMGMDLKNAASLVGKSIGSSTNALSRYGIEVHGAVGSTERFESILAGIKEKFGGQAAAKAATATGKYAQQMNILGDQMERVGKLLAPVVGGIAEIIAGVTKSAADFLTFKSNADKATESAAKQKIRFESLVDSYERLRVKVNRNNVEQKHYLETIKKLERLYPNYFKNINLEKDSYDKVKTAISGARQELKKYLEYQIKMAVLKDKRQEIIDLEKDKDNLETDIEKLEQRIERFKILAKNAKNKRSKAELEETIASDRVEIESLQKEIDDKEKTSQALQQRLINRQKAIMEIYNTAPESPISSGGTPSGSSGSSTSSAPPRPPLNIDLDYSKEILDAESSIEQDYTNRQIELIDMQIEAFQRREEAEKLALYQKQLSGANMAELDSELAEKTAESKKLMIRMQMAQTSADFRALQEKRNITEEEKKLIQEEKQARLNSLKIMMQAGGQQYKANESLTKQLAELTRNRIKQLISEAVMTQVAKAISYIPFPVNVIAAPAAGMAIEAILENMIPKFATGGIIATGSLHSAGGTIIEAERGEFIVNRQAVATADNREILEAMNSGRNIAIPSNSGFEMLAAKIEEQTDRLERVERIVSVAQLDEAYQEYQNQKRIVGLE